jgi:hypothetical protein
VPTPTLNFSLSFVVNFSLALFDVNTDLQKIASAIASVIA